MNLIDISFKNRLSLKKNEACGHLIIGESCPEKSG